MFENATILPLKKEVDDGLQFGLGGVITEQGFIKSSGIEGRVGGNYPHDVPEFRDQKVVYCGALIRQWGHFLIESVSRLWYFLENDETIDRYVFISSNSWFNAKEGINGNYREFFELFGIWDKLEILSVPTSFREVLIPELGYSRKYYYSDQYKAVFDCVRANALKSIEPEETYERVYLSRSKLKKAVQNECGLDLLDDFFVRNGYIILHPEELSLRKTIWLLQNASICAAESGTLPHNVLFCEDGKILEIVERQTAVNEIQANIDKVRELNVIYIDAHFTLYPTSAGWGPYFFAYNKQFAAFTHDRGYLPPNDCFLTEKYLKRNLQKFLKEYKKSYGLQWGFERWQLMYADAYYEAYEDTCEVLGEYLNRTKPLFFSDYFSLHFIKQAAKKFLKAK